MRNKKTVVQITTQDLLTTKQVVEELGVHPETVKRAIREGDLKAYHLGNGYKTTRVWLNEYLLKKIVAPTPVAVEG